MKQFIIILLFFSIVSCSKIEPEIQPLYTTPQEVDLVNQNQQYQSFKVSNSGDVWIADLITDAVYKYDGDNIFKYPSYNGISSAGYSNNGIGTGYIGINNTTAFFLEQLGYLDEDYGYESPEELNVLTIITPTEVKQIAAPINNNGSNLCLDVDGVYAIYTSDYYSNEKNILLYDQSWTSIPVPSSNYERFILAQNNFIAAYSIENNQTDIWVLNPETKVTQRFFINDYSYDLNKLKFDSKGNLYLTKLDGSYVLTFNFSTGVIHTTNLPEYTITDAWGTSTYQITATGEIAISDDDQVWVLCEDPRVYDTYGVYNLVSGEFILFDFSFGGSFYSSNIKLAIDHQGNFITINDGNRIAIFHKSDVIYYNEEQYFSISDPQIKVDDNNNYWFYSLDNNNYNAILLLKDNELQNISDKIYGYEY